MGKKATKKNTQDTVINESVDKSKNKETTPSTEVSKEKKLEALDIIQLVALEQACNKVCNRYEVSARLYLSTGDINDKVNNELFNEFKDYYDLIFKELKNRIIKYCK